MGPWWGTISTFLSTQEWYEDPVSGKLVRPHIRACLYAADQFYKAHQDHVASISDELVVLLSMVHILCKDGVAGYCSAASVVLLSPCFSCSGDWLFTPLTSEYLAMGPGQKSDRFRRAASSHDLCNVKTCL